MSRFYAPPDNVKGNLIYIEGREAKHILNVMRLKESDRVTVFDGTGKEYTGFIKKARPKAVIVEVVSTKVPKQGFSPRITLAQAIPKKDKMDYIVEKATELGVYSIIPVASERTVVKLDSDREAARVRRWRKIALEASKQCGRTDVPSIEDVRSFYDAVEGMSDFDLVLLACVSENTVSISDAISDFRTGKIIVFIGPEGDFTPDEVKLASRANAKFITLGRRVLKSDTAALYVLSVLSHELSR